MKIALYIEDGREQIVLTPDSKTERDILAKLRDGDRQLSIHSGGFYGCRGGWTRWKQSTRGMFDHYQSSREEDESTMIVLDVKPVETRPAQEDAA